MNALPDFHLYINPAVKPASEGRPKGGMFIAVPNCIRKFVENVSPSHWRIQAIKIKCSSSKILVINSYFPTDPRTQNFDETELVETIQCVRQILENEQYEFYGQVT